MGLKMPGDEEILANKIFLNRAATRSKARSWLSVSSGPDINKTSSSTSEKVFLSVDDGLSIIQTSDELSGIGVTPKVGQDDPTNRHLLSANEALRRKLLSKEAYKKYNDSKGGVPGAPRQVVKNKGVTRNHDDEEEKGKSIRQLAPQPVDVDNNSEGSSNTEPKAIVKNKKRPSTYLDQLLADRKSKQQKKAKQYEHSD